jgi:VIT1/CCC1 family predicted Fe2+/Mn2+ transporter
VDFGVNLGNHSVHADLHNLMSVNIIIVLLSVVGTLAALVAQVDVKKKVIELITAGLILSALTFLLGKRTSILIGMIQGV